MHRLAPVVREKIVRIVACGGQRRLIEENLDVPEYGAKPLNRHSRDAASIEHCLVFEAVNMWDVADSTLLSCDRPATAAANSFSPLKIQVLNAEGIRPSALRDAIAAQASEFVTPHEVAYCSEVS